MYLDEFSDKESDADAEQTPPSAGRKSLSDFRRNPTVMALKGTDGYNDCAQLQQLTLEDDKHPQKNDGRCPCGCFLSIPANGPFRTRDKNTLALYVVSADVLHHHGYSYEPTQIASFWKKDCRSFLWKGKAKDPRPVEPF